MKKRIDADIINALTAKGLTPVSEGRSDLNVRYTLGSGRRVEVESYPAGWRGLGTRVVRVPYAEGRLVLDLRDPATRSLVWRGIATEEKSDPNKLEGKLDDMVKGVREVSAQEEVKTLQQPEIHFDSGLHRHCLPSFLPGSKCHFSTASMAF